MSLMNNINAKLKYPTINLSVPGVPTPKQSARFGMVKNKFGKMIPIVYKDKEVRIKENNFKASVIHEISQKYPGFIPYADCGLSIKLTFVFPPLKSMNKKLIEKISLEKECVYKITKPDLGDNLKKLTLDAMNGVVYIDDAQICLETARKIYGNAPRTDIEISVLPDEMCYL